MLKKLSLIFIKISSSILALDLFLKLVLIYFPIDLFWIKVIDIVTKMILCIGFVILSFVFKYCTYHRSLLYIVIFGNILYLIYLIDLYISEFKDDPIDIIIVVYAIYFILITIIIIFISIYYYLKHGRNKEVIARKQSNIEGD